MSNRRYSVSKLSRRLRILEEDLVGFLDKHGVKEKGNSHACMGYDPDDIKEFLANLDSLTRNEMFLLKTRWEQENEKVKEEMESYLSTEEVSEIFDIPQRKTARFLTSNNVRKIVKNRYVFWDAITVLNMKDNPTKKQYVELNKLRSASLAQSHLNEAELASLFDVPEPLLPQWKRSLRVEGIYPFTRERALDVISAADYDTKRSRFLSREKKKASDRRETGWEEKQVIALIQETQDRESRKPEHTELIDGIPADRMFTSKQSATFLGVSVTAFRRVMKSKGISPNSFYTNRYKQQIELFAYSKIVSLKEDEQIVSAQLRSSKAREKVRNRQEALKSEKETVTKSIENNVVVNIRDRKEAPYSATLYVGPTNSGKTYNALQALYAEYEQAPEKTYVYAGPLRMLAYEVYVKMCERYGEDKVGFITGEEQINPEASLLATTTEMAPSEGESIVLDEAHWIVEPSRGHNWTNILVGGKYKTLHILTASEAKEKIKTLVDDAYMVTERSFKRKTAIKYAGDISFTALEKKTAIICFSRKTVYAIAKLAAEKTNLNVGVLYGALPLMAREKQINDFIAGDIDIIVTTDVIGHGINLPVDNVVYAETTKFDGSERRELYLWEAAQISGRAGRFGLSQEGKVYSLDVKWNKMNKNLISNSALAAAGKIGTGLKVNSALIAPRLTDLGVTQSDHLLKALETWQIKAAELLKGRNISPSMLKEQTALLETVAGSLSTPLYPWDKNKDERVYSTGLSFGEAKPIYPQGRAVNEWKIKPENVWQLISGPFDPKLKTVTAAAEWLQGEKKSDIVSDFYYNEVLLKLKNKTCNLEGLETIARIVSELKMLTVIFPDETGLEFEKLSLVEKVVSEEIIAHISSEMAQKVYSSCEECGKECAPWFSYCDVCYVENKKWDISYGRKTSTLLAS